MGYLDGFREFCEGYRPDPAADPKRRLDLFMRRAENFYLHGPTPKAFEVSGDPPRSDPREYKVFSVEQSGKGHLIKMTPHATSAVMDDAEYRRRKARGTDPRPGDTVHGPVFADGTFDWLRIKHRPTEQGR